MTTLLPRPATPDRADLPAPPADPNATDPGNAGLTLPAGVRVAPRPAASADLGLADVAPRSGAPAVAGPAATAPAATAPRPAGSADLGLADVAPRPATPAVAAPAEAGPAEAEPEVVGLAEAGPAGAGLAEVVLRAVGVADREAVRAFLAGLSLDSAYRRFFTGIGAPSGTLVSRLVDVDGDRRCVTVAVVGGEVVGLADTAVVDAGTVEVGVVVADRWQRHGLGPRLVAAALAPAIARGCTTLVAHTLADNARVARMIRRRWPGAEPAWDDDDLRWTLPL